MFVRLSRLKAVADQVQELEAEKVQLQLRNEFLEEEFMKKSIELSAMYNDIGRQALAHLQLQNQFNNLTRAFEELKQRELRKDMSKTFGNPRTNGIKGFTEDELKSLIQLVHPDKHGGKESAVRMLQIINNLRNS